MIRKAACSDPTQLDRRQGQGNMQVVQAWTSIADSPLNQIAAANSELCFLQSHPGAGGLIRRLTWCRAHQRRKPCFTPDPPSTGKMCWRAMKAGHPGAPGGVFEAGEDR